MLTQGMKSLEARISLLSIDVKWHFRLPGLFKAYTPGWRQYTGYVGEPCSSEQVETSRGILWLLKYHRTPMFRKPSWVLCDLLMVRQEIDVKIKLGLWFPEPAPVHPSHKSILFFKRANKFWRVWLHWDKKRHCKVLYLQNEK